MRWTRRARKPFDRMQWHRWFAWKPVLVRSDDEAAPWEYVVWLMWVERRDVFSCDEESGWYSAEYREPPLCP